MPRSADQKHNEFQEYEASEQYLRGQTPRQIAAHLNVGLSTAMKLISPTRKLVAAGAYDTQLAVLRERGFTNVPTSATAYGKPGRPRKPLTAEEQAMRAKFVAGKSLAVIAREHSTYAQRVRSIMAKHPNLLTARRGNSKL